MRFIQSFPAFLSVIFLFGIFLQQCAQTETVPATTKYYALIYNVYGSWHTPAQACAAVSAIVTAIYYGGADDYCYSQGGANSYAAKLSKLLGVSVTAPTTQTWNIGPFDIGPYYPTSSGKSPNLLQPSNWETFNP